MKKIHILKVLAISTLGLAWSGAANAGVAGSQHDLTANGQAQQTTGTTDQVCVFCHTPHGSDVNAPVPLWNKVLGAPGSYTQYSTLNTPTFDSTEAPVGSVSLACLSCHDGTQAMDVVINPPGSDTGPLVPGEIDTAAIGVMTGTPVPTLGTDLTDDHPVSMQYAGGGVNVTSHPTDGPFPGTVADLGDPDFNLPVRATVNGNPIWYVDSPAGTPQVREKTDMILYTRTEASVPDGQQPFVECGSCHDPHNDTTAGASSVAFLRIPNSASQICTTCHTK